MVTFGSHVGNHQFQPFLSGVYAGVIVQLEFLAGRTFLAVTCLCFHGSLIFDIDVDLTFVICSQLVPSVTKTTSSCAPMAESDRSRSPVPGRNRAEPGAPAPPVRQELPFFPRWCGPMQTAIWHSQQVSRPQSRPQFRPQFNVQQSGPYFRNQSMRQNSATQSGTWPNPRFPPAPPSSPPPTLAYPFPPRPSTPPCSPTLPCPPTQAASPSTPSIPSSQPRQAGTPYTNSPGGHTAVDDSRTYGFDLNPHWQEDKDHYDNQKINGLTFPRCIRQSAFTQKLDIEGCDPLKLPVAALLYQQANNFWLRKLAHGRELYLIPTGDIAAVVFMTELLTQLRNKGVDMDKVSSCKARQDGKLLDKTNNTKYAAQQIADLIHSWVPTRTADPDTQHESLLNSEANWHNCASNLETRRVNHPPRARRVPQPQVLLQHPSMQLSFGILKVQHLQHHLASILPLCACRHHHRQSVACSKHATSSCSTSFQQMAERTQLIGTKEEGSHGQYCQNRGMVGKSAGRSFGHSRTSGRHDGHPCQPHGKKLWCTEPPPSHDSRHQSHQLTSTSLSSQTQAQGASIPFAHSSFDDSRHLHFDSLHHDSQHPPFSGLPHHPNTYDGVGNPPRSSTQS